MHVHNIIWFAGLIFLLAILYRQLMTPVWTAALAAFLYTINDSNYFPAMWVANRNLPHALFCSLCAILAHNLNREVQMRTLERMRCTSEKRSQLWIFEKIQTLRNAFICKAGRFTRPAGKPTLTLNANPLVKQYMSNYLAAA